MEVVVARELMRKAVDLAKRAVDEFLKEQEKEKSNQPSSARLRPLIAGSLGPYGACQVRVYYELILIV